jgi:hypothetical protein
MRKEIIAARLNVKKYVNGSYSFRVIEIADEFDNVYSVTVSERLWNRACPLPGIPANEYREGN